MKMNSSQPTPSDFGDFVYCAAEWRYKKDPTLDAVVNGSIAQNSQMDRESNLSIGQANEKDCIEWVNRNYFNQDSQYKLVGNQYSEKVTLFDGTGKENNSYLTLINLPLDTTMKSKPDLILQRNGENFLFEFKALRSKRFLQMQEFESNHAQIWCYSHLEAFRIDKFVLFRYFKSPLVSYPDFKNIEPRLLDAKFTKKFESYITALSYINQGDIDSAGQIIHAGSINSYENHKCTRCKYIKICNYRRYSSKEGIY